MTDVLAGRTALVTGAGRGIGRAVALGLADAGADLILLARSADQLEETRALLAERGLARGGALVITADLAQEEERTRSIEIALARGRIDVLVNNAATVEPLGATTEIPAAELRWAFEVNVFAPIALTTAVLPGMTDAGWGRVVNVSSGIAARPEAMPRGNAYAATKAALEAHTINLAAEVRGTGVTVNVYRPGRVETAMQEWIRAQDPARIGAALHGRFTHFAAAGELISPEESAAGLLERLGGQETGAVWEAEDPAAARPA
ncbi:SDR family oxidoreductase [Actinospica sp.]|jgi:NAD(P)-dependent dehydrogenase (short-subunit alcohol dehydrogenase family)|uniref:SDR family NAD(P)-dependent oxidoreductase n=1 Tax=Actinospica sp. TaxID=1872142 RepID=UPI002C22FA11|nr:SDR family oxidoreductase [Actinospica sp.]HWG24277.1 SDR family oxidoreductase [Actinospica sp.]